jgi:hypothetical protein
METREVGTQGHRLDPGQRYSPHLCRRGLGFFDFLLGLEVLLVGPTEPGAALAHHTGDYFFRLGPDGVIMIVRVSWTQLALTALPDSGEF